MIVTDESRLIEPCNDASLEEGFKIIAKLEQELSDSASSGIGLAANQIGIQKRVCILRIPDTHDDVVWGHNFINPVIVEKRKPVIVKNEGCLSYPGKYVETLRYGEVKVVDTLHPSGRELTGWAAVCCQHETDHIDGVTMYMRRYAGIKINSPCPCGNNKKFRQCCQKKIKKNKVVLE